MRTKIFRPLLIANLLVLLSVFPSLAQRDSLPDGYPESLHQDLNRLILKQKKDPESVDLLVELGHVYFNMGDDLFTDKKNRLAAHKKGERVAKKALELDESQSGSPFCICHKFRECGPNARNGRRRLSS